MGDDLRRVDVEDVLAEPPDAAAIDRFEAAAPLIEVVAIHTGRAPSCAIVATLTTDCTFPIALRIDSAHFSAFASSQIAKIVGPDPLIEQPNAPASSAARLTSSKCGIIGDLRGSA